MSWCLTKRWSYPPRSASWPVSAAGRRILWGRCTSCARPARRVATVRPPRTAWELGQRLRGLGLESPVVVLGAAGQEGGAPALAGGQWLERASGEAGVTAGLAGGGGRP